MIETPGMKHLDYLYRVPESVPSGKFVVHNHVRPTRRLGSRGFRAWLAEPSPRYEVCPCEWAPELGAHYRVNRHLMWFSKPHGHSDTGGRADVCLQGQSGRNH